MNFLKIMQPFTSPKPKLAFARIFISLLINFRGILETSIKFIISLVYHYAFLNFAVSIYIDLEIIFEIHCN